MLFYLFIIYNYFKEASEIIDLDALVNSFKIDSILKEHDEFLKNYTPFKDSNSLGLFANGWVYIFLNVL